MHNYTVLNRFQTKTKLGNWYEESELKDYEFKEYLYRKNQGQNIPLNTQSKLAFSNQPVTVTQPQEGRIHYGDSICLQNLYTEGVLAFNINEQILGEETYAATTSKNLEHLLRNTFQVEPVGDCESTQLRYGDKFRLSAVAGNKKVYLQSLAVSPTRSSKFSRHQEVSVTAESNARSLWVIEHVNPKARFDSIGEIVDANCEFLIKHNATCQWLASEKVNYVNEFGAEFQVFSKSFLSNNKTQNLFSEKVGHKSVQNTLRNQGAQNSWRLLF